MRSRFTRVGSQAEKPVHGGKSRLGQPKTRADCTMLEVKGRSEGAGTGGVSWI